MAIAVVNDEDLASNERSINNLGFSPQKSSRKHSAEIARNARRELKAV
jgi:hypothetical protein